MTQKIQAIAFDMFGVIVTEGHLISKTLMGLLPKHIKKPQVKTLYNQFNIGEISEAEFWQPLQLDTPFTAPHSIRQQFLDSFQLDPNLPKVISTLKNQYQLSILSNFPPDWADYLEQKFNLQTQFAPRIFSGNVGCKKPDEAIYLKLAQASHLDLSLIAFIDDNLENLYAAKKLGITTVYFPNEGEFEQYDHSIDYHITQLSDILAIFN